MEVLHTSRQVLDALDKIRAPIAHLDNERAEQLLRDNDYVLASTSLVPEALAHRKGRNW
jgi:hypothetical protein